MTGLTIPDFTKPLIEIAGISEKGNATIPYTKLTEEQKQAVQTLLGFSGKVSGDIVFGEMDEAILRVINNSGEGIDKALVTIITPIDDFGRPYLN